MNKINPPLFQASYAVVKNYAFDGEKLSLELGSFIVTIALGEASYFERILCGITETPPQYVQVLSTELKKLVDLYDSKIVKSSKERIVFYLSYI